MTRCMVNDNVLTGSVTRKGEVGSGTAVTLLKVGFGHRVTVDSLAGAAVLRDVRLALGRSGLGRVPSRSHTAPSSRRPG